MPDEPIQTNPQTGDTIVPNTRALIVEQELTDEDGAVIELESGDVTWSLVDSSLGEVRGIAGGEGGRVRAVFVPGEDAAGTTKIRAESIVDGEDEPVVREFSIEVVDVREIRGGIRAVQLIPREDAAALT